MNYYGTSFWAPTDLAHYGVKGMRWGVRRYETASGHLTAAGRRRYLGKQIKADNRIAFKLGKQATVDARSARLATKKRARAEARYAKKQSDKNYLKLRNAQALEKKWAERSKESKRKAEEHYKSLVNKYGAKSIKAIKYDKNGDVNEKVRRGLDTLLRLRAASGQAGLVTAYKLLPEGKRGMARRAYRQTAKEEYSNANRYFEELDKMRG